MLTKSLDECQAYYRDRERVSMNEINNLRLAAIAHSTPSESRWPYSLLVTLWRRRPHLKVQPTHSPVEPLTAISLTAE